MLQLIDIAAHNYSSICSACNYYIYAAFIEDLASNGMAGLTEVNILIEDLKHSH